MSLFEELKRRNVFRVGMAYAVSAWVVLQIVDLVLDNSEAPGWVMDVYMLVVILGFLRPIVSLRKTHHRDPMQRLQRLTLRRSGTQQ